MGKQKNRVLTLDTGTEKIDVKDLYGNTIAQIVFHPSDFNGFSKRLNDMTERLKKALDEIVADSDIEGTDPFFKEEATIVDAFDRLFGYSVGTNLFTSVSATAITENGYMFWEEALNGIADEMKRAVDERTERMNKRVAEETAEYADAPAT